MPLWSGPARKPSPAVLDFVRRRANNSRIIENHVVYTIYKARPVSIYGLELGPGMYPGWQPTGRPKERQTESDRLFSHARDSDREGHDCDERHSSSLTPFLPHPCSLNMTPSKLSGREPPAPSALQGRTGRNGTRLNNRASGKAGEEARASAAGERRESHGKERKEKKREALSSDCRLPLGGEM